MEERGGYVRVMSSARRTAGKREKNRGKGRGGGGGECRYLVGRSTEAQKAVAKKRGKVCHASGTRGERLAASRKSSVFYFRPGNNTVGAAFSRSLPPRQGWERFEESGPTNDFLAKLKMHSTRDANSFSRVRAASSGYNRPLTLSVSPSFRARTGHFQRWNVSRSYSSQLVLLAEIFAYGISYANLFSFFSFSVPFTTFRFNRRRSLFTFPHQ